MNTPTIGNRSRPPRTHVITGDRDQVTSAMRCAQSNGRLVAVTDHRELPGNRLQLVAQLHDPLPARIRWEQIRPWLTLAAKTVATLVALAAAAALLWLIVTAVLAVIAFVTAVVAWISTHLLLLGFLAMLGLFALCSSAARCEGLHCGGCRR